MFTLNLITNRISSFDPASDFKTPHVALQEHGEEVETNGTFVQTFIDEEGKLYTAELSTADYFQGKAWNWTR